MREKTKPIEKGEKKLLKKLLNKKEKRRIETRREKRTY